MSLVTERRQRAVYAMLREFPPFCRWDLPEPGAVRFRTFDDLTDHADYVLEGSTHMIRFSNVKAWSLPGLVLTMAHEMAHMRQELQGKLPRNECRHHNRAFHKIADAICSKLGFDREDFT